MSRRPNPRVALDHILNSNDHAQALERMTMYLSRAWVHGHTAGFQDGVSDAMDDKPHHTSNPYEEQA